MNENEVFEILKSVEAIKEGHFQFSSGLHSETYIQCAMILKEPKISGRICAAIADLFRDDKPDLVVGPALGGIIVAYEVARALGVPGFWTEREQGKMQLRRSFIIKPGQRVLVVEDVITTGGSSQEVVNLAQEMGGQVIGVGAIVDRSNGKAKISVPFRALISREMNNYDPTECPLCQQGIPLYKPGSRENV